MKNNYSIILEGQNPNVIETYKLFNTLMETYEFSGVFSDALIKKVYILATRLLTIKERLIDGTLAETESIRQIQRDIRTEYSELLNTYSIFSDDFKIKTLGLFFAIETCKY